MATDYSNGDRSFRRRTNSAAEGESSPNWLELPPEVTAVILQKLGAIDTLKNAQKVCSQWRSICKEPSTWSTIDMRNSGFAFNVFEKLAVIFREAVDRSCGGVVDLNIEYFGNDQLLNYVTQRCSQIRRLRVVLCYGRITDVGLCEAAKRLPLLEELEISYCNVTAKALQKFGECCPQLRSLKRNQPSVGDPNRDDSDAMAIAKHMPKLCHLQLFGNHLTNRGLKAVLDGCPNLESLDLRQCLNVIVDPKCHKAILCAERVKHFRGPFDSIFDYEFDTAVYGSLRLFKTRHVHDDGDWLRDYVAL